MLGPAMIINRFSFLVSMVALLIVSSSASAINRVEVVSATFPAGGANFEIRVKITNDVPLRGIVVPLELRDTIVGSNPFVTAMTLGFGERLAGNPLSDILVANQYEERQHYCVASNSIGYDHPVVTTVGETHQVLSTPEGVMFVRMSTFSAPLPPGTDSLGSLVMTVSLTPDTGVFIVDTTCTWECNNLLFVEDSQAPYELIKPEFIRGMISTYPCDCPSQGDLMEDGFLDALDLNALIQRLFFGGGDILDEQCPNSRADINGDGVPDALDLNAMIDLLFFGGAAPNDPCTN